MLGGSARLARAQTLDTTEDRGVETGDGRKNQCCGNEGKRHRKQPEAQSLNQREGQQGGPPGLRVEQRSALCRSAVASSEKEAAKKPEV